MSDHLDAVAVQYKKNKDLRSLNFRDGEYQGARLGGALFDDADLSRAIFQDATLNDASLRNVRGKRTDFVKANLSGADLRGGDWSGTDFKSANLENADLGDCTLTPDTQFDGAKVNGMRIDRHSLRMLGEKHGGLTAANIATLKIDDDQAKLIISFGGFWTTLHVLAVAIFATPYLVFGVKRYLAARVIPCSPTSDCVTLRSAIWDHIVSGGVPGQTDILAVVLFVLLLAYNVFRISLVYKARSLELAEHARKTPIKFDLRGYWYVAYYACQILVWLNLGLALIHAYQFLNTPVPRSIAHQILQ